MTEELLDQAGVARRLGLAESTIRAARARDPGFPEPDVWLGRSPGWYASTIDQWRKNRPGMGYRTDLKGRP